MIVQHKVLEPGVNMLQKPFTRLDLAKKVRSTLEDRNPDPHPPIPRP